LGNTNIPIIAFRLRPVLLDLIEKNSRNDVLVFFKSLKAREKKGKTNPSLPARIHRKN
jgi:hypothetical protein